MNRDQWIGRLQQFVGIIEETWGHLSDEPELAVTGRKAQFTGRIRAQLGLSRAKADRQLGEFLHRHRHWKITA
ncbi:MAG: hypothetical protein Q8M20_04075 [Rhodocyclaceae bacterium]|nr:hypothetical protein [Rhodocyclaceae bacterium]MDZ4213936.1 hypothetical protein [Rhodocyclaceae bacterium]